MVRIDIDEAIVSRCIAMIKFHPPDGEPRLRIWKVMPEQLGLAAGTPLLDQLVEPFPTASGRDIIGLTKLVAKYCLHKKVGPSLDVFKRCAVFRGIDLDHLDHQQHLIGDAKQSCLKPDKRQKHNREKSKYHIISVVCTLGTGLATSLGRSGRSNKDER